MASPLLDRASVEARIRDLADRWRRARRAALRSVASQAPEAAEGDDEALLAAALARDPEAALRRVFENGVVLGEGYARHHGAPLGLDDLPRALAAMEVPCLTGSFAEVAGERALTLTRSGCPGGSTAARCDFHREAVLGLVLGATGGVRHTRHESLGHRGGRCVDLFHEAPESPLRFGPLPDELRPALERAARLARAFDSTAEVRFLGLSEGELLYQLERGGGLDVRAVVERAIHRSHPDIALREISPRPVMDG